MPKNHGKKAKDLKYTLIPKNKEYIRLFIY